MHAFEEKVRGSGSIPAMFGGGEADLKMYQDSLGIAYGWKL
jgi:long-chain fatty acid transport protein